MIRESAEQVAAAIAAQLGEGVPVYDVEPDTTAAPAVWLTFAERRYEPGAGWTIVHDATVVADAASGATDAQRQLNDLTDAVCELVCPGVVTTDLVARGGGLTVRIGDTAHPCRVVTIPQLSQVC